MKALPIDWQVHYLLKAIIQMKKEMVLEALNDFTEDFNLDDFLEKLIVIEKINEGLEDEKNNEVISHQDVKKEIDKWRK